LYLLKPKTNDLHSLHKAKRNRQLFALTNEEKTRFNTLIFDLLVASFFQKSYLPGRLIFCVELGFLSKSFDRHGSVLPANSLTHWCAAFQHFIKNICLLIIQLFVERSQDEDEMISAIDAITETSSRRLEENIGWPLEQIRSRDKLGYESIGFEECVFSLYM
jgi:hypothetical protein